MGTAVGLEQGTIFLACLPYRLSRTANSVKPHLSTISSTLDAASAVSVVA